jgi:hypothetical protein
MCSEDREAAIVGRVRGYIHSALLRAMVLSPGTAQGSGSQPQHCSGQWFSTPALLRAMVLNPPNAGTIYYSSSWCGDPNHNIISLLQHNSNFVTFYES